MKWTFEEYLKEAEKTADYVDESYPLFSYYEEVGELIGKLSKGWFRGDYIIVKEKPNDESIKYILYADILKELGDICWMQALNEKEHFVSKYTFFGYNKYPKNETEFQVACAAESLLHSRNSTHIFPVVARIAEYFGSSLDEVLTMNIEKLKSRKERGVIKSNGDNR